MTNKALMTLVSFLGRARQDSKTGYRTANYRFANGAIHSTPFFGLALREVIAPARLVLLGTAGSMWDVLIEQFATEGEDEELRLKLIEAATENAVDGSLLDAVTPLVERALGVPCLLRLIDYGRDAEGQARILDSIAESVSEGHVSIDLTHGFRHLAAIGALSAFFLERVRGLTIEGIYYGALDMTENGETPVLRLDGLLNIERWLDALSRFDQNGDYGLFAPLLCADGVAPDKVQCLLDAAFFERTLNLSDARRRILTFLPVLGEPLTGVSALFRSALAKRLEWVRGAGLMAYQRRLAGFYLHQGDYVRAAILGFEAVITRECDRRKYGTQDHRNDRKPAEEAFEAEIRTGDQPRAVGDAYWMLKNLRNALAHGNPSALEKVRQIIASPERLPAELQRAMDRVLN
ncbi:CRISPR-associated protein, TM1812 family [Thiorhodococcus drewsii AZ1]|uniref:CRISPR-associated protein, TM1812 family n=1 Tax=Thiorhodococcus drewsii AZ1 TaxID=765913 RepID=G2DYK9_9GAMM|nr:TIGR02221 family CRISPR-associated protein [Thiorhodococcus drewsii]EGV32636.1 CRISPR-associated protein, TM1812 family [Thiorhodococcus drewsii AZ1]